MIATLHGVVLLSRDDWAAAVQWLHLHGHEPWLGFGSQRIGVDTDQAAHPARHGAAAAQVQTDSFPWLAGMQVSDRPDRSIAEDFQENAQLDNLPADERRELMRERHAESYYGANRLFVGRNGGGDATLVLNDAAGNPRMVLKVAPEGEASIEFLDDAGEVAHRLAPEVSAQ